MTTGTKTMLFRAAPLACGLAFIGLLGATFAGDPRYTKYTGVFPLPAVFTEAPLITSAVELAVAKQATEETCLAEALYYEARGEGEEGQKAVAEVILQRVQNKLYPKTICGVVYQGAERTTGCQFSFACDGSRNRALHQGEWEKAKLLAAKIVSGSLRLAGRTQNAVSFHTVGVTPIWSRTMMRVTQIGNHIFYRHMPKSMRPRIFAAVEPVKVVFDAAQMLPEILIAEEHPAEGTPDVQLAEIPSGGV
jgi:hypothetical protein